MTAVISSGKRIRVYRSERRSEQARQTRQRIVRAAHAAFLASGYAGTTVHDIATAAGVSVKTVEAVFGTKRRVLKAVIDVATAGDDLPVAVLQREAARAAEATTDPVTFLAIVARAVATVAENVADILVVVDQGAAVDEELSAVAAQLDEQRTVIATWIVENLTRRAALQPGLTERTAIDTVWLLLDPVVFRRLTRDRHWSTDDFRTWLTTSLRLVLLAPQKSPRSSGAGPA
jgi:AcrR family transcriptional regulator